MWLFAVKYLQIFFAQRVLGKEREVDLFPSKFPWSLPGSHPEIISSNFTFSGIWGFAQLKNKIFIPVNTNDAPLFKYNIILYDYFLC